MTHHERGYRRQVDLVVFADRLGEQTGGQGRAAAGALVRIVIDHTIEILAQSPAMTFMTRLGTAPGRDLSRCALRSVEGGLDELRDVLAGR